MRNVIVSRVLSVLLAVAGVGFFASTTSAATKQLAGTYSVGQVETDCINAGGTVTSGTGSGGYGCRTSKGSVSCTKDGQCTGTCGNCAASKPTPRDTELSFALRNGAAPIKAKTPDPGKPTKTAQPAPEASDKQQQ
jgi:hypothetical protein